MKSDRYVGKLKRGDNWMRYVNAVLSCRLQNRQFVSSKPPTFCETVSEQLLFGGNCAGHQRQLT